MRKIFILFVFLGSVVTSVRGAEIKLPSPDVETLPNGLKIVWFVNKNLPVIDLSLIVQTGYRNDPEGRSGTAELVSSTLDRGAGGLNTQEFARTVEVLGATRYSSVDEDTFSVGMHGLAIDGFALLDLLGKLSLSPEFPDAEILREHARLLDRWNHLGDAGETLASLAYHRKTTSGSSYGRGNFLSVHEFEKVKKADVLSFYKTYFTPKNSILLIVGRVDQTEFKKKILEKFGNWQGEATKSVQKKFSDRRLETRKDEILLVSRPSLTQAQVRLGFKAPLIQAPEHYALVVANAMVGEYFNSRLNTVLRDKMGITYGISSSFSYSKDLAEFTVSSSTRNETVGQLVQKTLDILRDFKKGNISDEEIQMAKEYLAGGFPLSVSTLSSIAMRWIVGLIYNLSPEYLNEFVPKIKQITRTEVVQAVAKDFDLDHLVVVIAGDPVPILKSLKESHFRMIKTVTVKDLM